MVAETVAHGNAHAPRESGEGLRPAAHVVASPHSSARSSRTPLGVSPECDYPHSDSMWPDAPEVLWDVLARFSVPDSDINKMTHENAMRWYQFDPFAHVPKEQATVGALRKSVAGHDISVQSRSHRIIAPEEKLEAYRSRARAVMSGATPTR